MKQEAAETWSSKILLTAYCTSSKLIDGLEVYNNCIHTSYIMNPKCNIQPNTFVFDFNLESKPR